MEDARIVNINYKGRILDNVDHLPFRHTPPVMYVEKIVGGGTLIIFPNGKCRLMGIKTLHSNSVVPYRMLIECIISATITFNLAGGGINLRDLASNNNNTVVYEPELFPALRLNHFRPHCVNVFASGKVVVTGLKRLDGYKNYARQIRQLINTMQQHYQPEDASILH